MHVAVTPSETESGLPRPVDDWQPRANITKLFNNGKISLHQQDEITKFSLKHSTSKESMLLLVSNILQI